MSRKSINNLFFRLYYGWQMIGVVSAIRIVGGGLHGYGFTVFFLPISADLGITRAQTSLAFSLARAEGAIEAPLVGYLVDRFGPRPMITTAALLTGVGYILFSWVNSYTSFLLVYLGVISIAFTAGFVQSPMVVANSWFIRQRARAMTVVSAAVPIGGALISPLLAVGVTHLGWRWAAFISGCAFLMVCLPLSLKVERSPESMNLLPDGDSPQEPDASAGAEDRLPKGLPSETDVSVGDAMKTSIYWLIVIAMLTRVGAHSTVIVHFVPLMVWKGLTPESAALLLGSFALLNLLAHFILGWIADRMNKPQLLAACMLMPALSVLLLIWGGATWPLWVFTIFYTVIDASFPIGWAMVGDFFGRKYFGTIRGTMSFFYMWGGVLGPVIAGAIYDHSESYEAVLWGLFFLLLFAAVVNALLIRPWSHKAMAVRFSTCSPAQS